MNDFQRALERTIYVYNSYNIDDYRIALNDRIMEVRRMDLDYPRDQHHLTTGVDRNTGWWFISAILL